MIYTFLVIFSTLMYYTYFSIPEYGMLSSTAPSLSKEFDNSRGIAQTASIAEDSNTTNATNATNSTGPLAVK
ncbi:MAG: hypothetical protein V1678_01645 [Candidatus Aenigmatarchaeota archaeon]